MKKIFNLISVLIVMVLLVFTPAPLVSVGISAMAADDFHFTAPEQPSSAFLSEPIGEYTISSWDKKLSDYAVTDQIDRSNIDEFSQKYPSAIVIPNAKIYDRKATIMTRTTVNTTVNGYLKSPEISLTANGYFKISVWYYVLGESSYFYLSDNEIALSESNDWQQSSFYVKTDKLENAKFTAELYLGSKTNYIVGGVYYDKFSVEAIREQDYTREVNSLNTNEREIDLTDKENIKVVKEYIGGNDFKTIIPENNAKSYNKVSSTSVTSLLDFEDRDTFYTKNGVPSDNLILLAAEESFAGVQLNDSTFNFKPLPHEVYMFQFYSISSSDTDKLYLRVGETYHEISNVKYNYINGWQLNTIFYIGDAITYQDKDENDEGYSIGLYVGNDQTPGTGWACIDGLSIYKVSGEYATSNASALGVHDTYDLNQREEGTITNSFFDRGTASDLDTVSYPYPLKASGDWTTEGAYNGIVNTKYWQGITVDNPGKVHESYKLDNNIYMLRNVIATTNELKSPALSTTAGNKTYVSFDAIGQTGSKTRAVLKAGDIVVGELEINEGSWHRYEFEINEGSFAQTRTYTLSFIMEEKGVSFFDNVRTGSNPDNSTTGVKTTKSVDLNNPVSIKGIWKADDKEFYSSVDSTGVMLSNIGKENTTVTNTFGYSVTADTYYKFTVTARGSFAYLAVTGFDGHINITKNMDHDSTLNEYTLYFYTGLTTDSEEGASAITLVNLQVKLGFQKEEEDDEDKLEDGIIYISNMSLESIDEAVYTLAEKNQENDKNIKVLTPTSTIVPEEPDEPKEDENDVFGSNWWFLVPSIITALAIIIAIAGFLLRKFKFNKHITAKGTSYAKDIKLKKTKKKIVAEQAAKVDNIINESKDN